MGKKNGLKLTSFTNVQGTTDFQLVRKKRDVETL